MIKKIGLLNMMLVLVPVPIIAKAMGMSPILVFATACLAVIPVAGIMGRATEHLSDHLGPAKGALLNALFGNACEFILAFFALQAGLFDVVKASITGSIIGNVLLVLGASMFAGGMKHKTQTFNKTAASTSATLLALAAIGLVMPAAMHQMSTRVDISTESMSLAISGVLIVIYLCSLVFQLKTHRALYGKPVGHEGEEAIGVAGWSMKRSLITLVCATATVAVLAECLVGAVEHAAESLGMTQLFVGVVLVAIVGNAAENSSAIMMAMKNRMDLSLNIALGCSTQLALLVAPLLVFIGFFTGHQLNLVFNPLEIAAVVVAVLSLPFVTSDGESNWLEGVMLLGIYVILGVAFFFV